MPKVLIHKLYLLLFIFSLCYGVANAQYYTEAELITIHQNKTASEGDLYLDTINSEYFIGVTSGELTYLTYDSNEVVGELLENMLDEKHLQSNSDVNTVTQKSVKTYIDSLFALSGNEAIFPIYAEEGGNLAVNTTKQYSFGNGNVTSTGIIIPQTCTLFAVGLVVNSGSAEVEVVKNNALTGASSGLASSGISGGAIQLLATPLTFNQGDVLNFQTIVSNSGSAGRAVAWFRIQSKTPSFFRFNGSGLPIAALGVDGDEFLDNSTGDLYFKENGVWILKINLKGPAGSVSERAFVQVTNALSGNINSGSVSFNWIKTDASSILSNDISKFSVSTDGITFTNGGTYKITIYQNQFGIGPDRTNAGLQLKLDGVDIGPTFSNTYMRNTSNHNQSTGSLTFIVSVSGGQKIGFSNIQLTTVSTVVTVPENELVFIVEEM